MDSDRTIYRLGRFTLKQQPLELRDGRRLVAMPLKQLEVLLLIVHAQGKTVGRNDFLDKVWSGSFVEDANLTQTVFLLRRVLGRLPNGANLIETVPRGGYRLSSHALGSAEETAGDTYPDKQPSYPGEGEQLQLLVDSLEDYAIYMLDCAGRVLTWNPGAQKSKGYKSNEIIGQHFSMFFVPEDVEARVPERELSVACRKGKCVGEGWRLRRNGERYWASFVITAIRDSSGRLIGYGKVFRDLSERKRHDDTVTRLEALLRRERDVLRAAAEGSMDAIYIFEALRGSTGDIDDFTFIYTNNRVGEMLKVRQDQLLGRGLCALFPVNVTSGLFEEYKRVALTGTPYTGELQINQNDLVSWEWIRFRAVRLNDGILVTASDISELKRIQQGLQNWEPRQNTLDGE